MKRKAKDFTGERFGRLVVLGEAAKRPGQRHRRVEIQCDCGAPSKSVFLGMVTSGRTTSCGCFRNEQTGSRSTTRKENFVGQRFNQLLVIADAPYRDGTRERLVIVQCDCGSAQKEVWLNTLKSGCTISCGCYQKNRMLTHGDTANQKRPRIYRIWTNMKTRCTNPKADNYCYYGEQGVTVCDEWQDYIPFKQWAESHGYAEDLSIDRIDPCGNYQPGNCRWVTQTTQMNNLRKQQES